MKIIFLDFDGVLNSEASFHMEFRKKKLTGSDTTINETLSEVCCSNFQMILDAVPDAEIVISSAWRVFFTLDWLKAKLSSYGIDSSKVRGVTGRTLSGHRGREIREYLEDIYEARGEQDPKRPLDPISYIVIDDTVGDLQNFEERLIATTWKDGLTLEAAQRAAKLLGGKLMTESELAKQDAELADAADARRKAAEGNPTLPDINL